MCIFSSFNTKFLWVKDPEVLGGNCPIQTSLPSVRLVLTFRKAPPKWPAPARRCDPLFRSASEASH